MRWWARLSGHGTRCLEQVSRHPDFKAAFDDLLDIPGLWGGMRISTLNRMISMRCDDVSLPRLAYLACTSLKLIETGGPVLSHAH